MRTPIGRQLRSARGVATSEVLVIAGVIVLALIGILGIFGNQLGTASGTIARCINAAVRGQFGACGGGASSAAPAAAAVGGAGPINPATGLPMAAMGASAAGGGAPLNTFFSPSVGASISIPPAPTTPGRTAAASQLGVRPGPAVAPDAQKVRDSARNLLKLVSQNPPAEVSSVGVLTDTYARSVGLDDTVRNKGEELSNKAFNEAMAHVRRANAQLQQNDVAGADAEIRQAWAQLNRANQFASLAEGQNANLAQQGMNDAAYVHEQAKNAEGVVSAFAPPGVSKAVDNIFRATSFVVTSEMEGREAAVTNLATDLAFSAVINKGMNALGGRSVKNTVAQAGRQEGTQIAQAVARDLNSPAVANEVVTTTRAVVKDVRTALETEGRAAAGQLGRAEANAAGQAARTEGSAVAGQVARTEGNAVGQVARTEGTAAGQAARAETNAATAGVKPGNVPEPVPSGGASAAASGGNVGGGTTHGPPPSYGGQSAAEREAAIRASNLSPGHAEGFSDVARANGQSVIVRDPSKGAARRLEEGAVPKPMSMKQNTADARLIPELEGAIPAKAKFSKVGSEMQALGQERRTLEEKLKTPGGLSASDRARLKEVKDGIADLRTKRRYQDKLTQRQLSLPEGHPDKIYTVKDPHTGMPVLGMKDKGGKIVPVTGDADVLGATGLKNGPATYSGKTGWSTSSSRRTAYDLNRAAPTKSGQPLVPHGFENQRVLTNPNGAKLKPNTGPPFTSFNADGSVTKIKTTRELKDFINKEHRAGRRFDVPSEWGWQGKPGSWR